jgi:hypothetical protein
VVHPDYRASDADRHAVAEQLARHTGAGRLTLDEFDQRVRAAWAAQTHADLHRLLLDLPGPIPASQAPNFWPGLVPVVVAVLVAVLGFAVPLMALGRMPGCM